MRPGQSPRHNSAPRSLSGFPFPEAGRRTLPAANRTAAQLEKFDRSVSMERTTLPVVLRDSTRRAKTFPVTAVPAFALPQTQMRSATNSTARIDPANVEYKNRSAASDGLLH